MNEKIKVQLKDAFPILSEMLVISNWCKMMGRSSGWIYPKIHALENNTGMNKFSRRDMYYINETLNEIGTKLLATRITKEPNYSYETYGRGETVGEQLKCLGKVVSLPYIYNERLKKGFSWFQYRIRTSKSGFTDEELTMINIIINEIANKILSIEVTL